MINKSHDLVGNAIILGRDGVSIEYDAAGNRAAATYGYDGHKESYSYTADGYLENTYINGVRRSSRTNDALGRVTRYLEYAANGTVALNRTSAYDNDNRITSTTTVDTDKTTTQTYDYRLWNGSAYAGADQGVVTHVRTVEDKVTTQTDYHYVWWDEAKQSSITINATNPSNPNTGKWGPGLSRMSYDVNGHLKTLTDSEAGRVVSFASDAYGQVLVREERLKGVLGPRQLHYYFNGQRIGDVGNNGRSANLTDYAAQMAASGTGTAASRGGFRFGRPVASADFDQNYQPINAGYPGPAATAYTVRSGDTLRTIAQAVWGDGAMWYLIAEANGLSAGSTLTAGQRLIIPNKVTNIHNTSGTLRVYDPGEAIGDTLPTLPNEPAPPPPQKHGGGCGGFGAILLIVVAIAVTVVTAGAAVAALGPAGTSLSTGIATVLGTGAGITGGVAGAAAGIGLGGAIAIGAGSAALGSIVSQGIGLATGLQDRFSWKAVGLAAIAGGVGAAAAPGAAFGNNGLFGGIGSKVVGAALRGAASSAISQGIGIATGLQDRFDWAGVASAGASAGVGASINMGGTGGKVLTNAAAGLAASAAESLVTGRDFGDTIMANLPSIIGNTVGNLVAEKVSSALSDKETVDYLQREGGLSRDEARALLHDAKLSGIDQAGAGGGGTKPNADLQTRRARFDALEARLAASGGAKDSKFLQFKRMYELSLLSGDVYLNKSDPYVTGAYTRLQGDGVSQATGGALTAADLVDARSGYFSAIYRNGETGELVYANRGTEFGQAGDRSADVLQAIGKSDPQYTRAMENSRELKAHGVSVTFTGHSLGGGLATAQAIVSGYRAIVFNPAGVHANTVGGAAMLARQNGLVTNVTVNGEFLSSFQDGGKLTVGSILDAATANPRAAPGDYYRRLAAEVPRAGGSRMTLAPAYLARPRGAYVSIPGSPGHGITSVADSLFYRYEQGWR